MEEYVALLGVRGGPAVRPGSHMPTSSLLCMAGQTIVLDAGIGVTRGICDQGVQLKDINMIIISHLHSDHYVELGPLIHTAWTTGLVKELDVYGPPGLKAYWDHFQKAMSFDTDLRIADEGRRDLGKLIRIHEFDAGNVATRDGLKIDAMRNHHPPIEDSFAFRFTSEGASVVMSGDTTFIPEMADFAKNADLLVHEAMLLAGVEEIVRRNANGDDRLRQHILRSHTAADGVGRIATQAGVGHLALNHLVPDDVPGFSKQDWVEAVRTTWDGPLSIGVDGLRLPLAGRT